VQSDSVGIVQRCTKVLLGEINKYKDKRRITFNVSFMQLYNEKIYDLLNREMFKNKKNKMVFNQLASNPAEGLKLKWNHFDVYTVENLITVDCSNQDEVLHLFHHGIQNKVLGSHKMNLTSSRSHTVFCITIEQVHADNPDNTIVSKL